MKITFLLLITCFSFHTKAQDSTYTVYWNEQTKKLEGSFFNHKKEGEWNKWNEKGQLIEKEIYQNGILIQNNKYKPKDNEVYTETNYHKNGMIKSSGKIILENKEGNWIYYNENGIETNVIRYKNGLGKEEYKIKKQKSTSKEFDTNGYLRGSYLDKDDNRSFGYLKLTQYGTLKYKHKLEDKPIRLQFSEIKYYYLGANKYVILESVKLKPCPSIGQTTYKNLSVKLVLSGRINLFATGLNCALVGTVGISHVKSDKVFIIQKGSKGEITQIRLGSKSNREKFLKLFDDDNQVRKELRVEVDRVEKNYSRIISIIRKYNSK